jgi:hypothetical protein
MAYLYLLCGIDELCVAALVRPNKMGDSVDDIDTMYN